MTGYASGRNLQDVNKPNTKADACFFWLKNTLFPVVLSPAGSSTFLRAVQLLNGPGNNAAAIRNGTTHELEPGDVFVIPAGTGHQFTKIDDHITYLMIRVDPDKVIPSMDAAASQAYLIENGQ